MRRTKEADAHGRGRPAGRATKAVGGMGRVELSAIADGGAGAGTLTTGVALPGLPSHASAGARSPGGGAQQSWVSAERCGSGQGQGATSASRRQRTPATVIALRPARLISDPTPVRAATPIPAETAPLRGLGTAARATLAASRAASCRRCAAAATAQRRSVAVRRPTRSRASTTTTPSPGGSTLTGFRSISRSSGTASTSAETRWISASRASRSPAGAPR